MRGRPSPDWERYELAAMPVLCPSSAAFITTRRGDIGRRVAALVLPISNRPRVTSSCAGKIGLREPGEHTSGPNLASRDNVAHSQTTILETPPPATLLHPIRWSMGLLSSQHPVALVG